MHQTKKSARVFSVVRVYALWILIALGFVFFNFAQSGAILGNDGFQYLSTAKNILTGQGAKTSLIHFDEQHFSGEMPAPQTVFPPGYPLTLAFFAFLGMSTEAAGVFVSIVATALLIPVFLWGGKLLKMRTGILYLLTAFLVMNSNFSFYAISILSESLFTLLSFLGLILLVRSEVASEKGENPNRYLFVGGIVLGVACWVRYAGVFLVAPMLFYYTLNFLFRRNQRARKALILASSCLPLVIGEFLRNLFLAGNLRGGNLKPAANSFVGLVVNCGHSIVDLLLGSRSPKNWFPGMKTFFAIAVCLTGLFLVVQGVRNRTAVTRYLCCRPVSLVWLFLIVYLCGLLYAGKTSVISFGVRMFYPVYPVALMLLGGVLSNILERSPIIRSGLLIRVSLISGVIFYSLLLLKDTTTSFRSVYTLGMRDAIAQPIGDSRSLTAWLATHTPEHQPILAGDGQACGYLTGKDTISLVSTEYSNDTWSEDRIRKTAKRYNAHLLALFPQGQFTREIADESPLINGILHGIVPPWLRLEIKSPSVEVYRLL